MNLVQYCSLPSCVTPCEPKVVMVQYVERVLEGLERVWQGIYVVKSEKTCVGTTIYLRE
jgi:hypothetical protein